MVCECYIIIKFLLLLEIVINKDKLLNNLKYIRNIANINIIKCYYILFTKNGIIKNIGNYIMSIIIIFTIILDYIIDKYNNLKNNNFLFNISFYDYIFIFKKIS